MCSGRIEAENIYIQVCSQGAGAVDPRYVQPFFVGAGLWECVPGGFRWEDMGFGKCFKEFVICFSTFSIYFFSPLLNIKYLRCLHLLTGK